MLQYGILLFVKREKILQHYHYVLVRLFGEKMDVNDLQDIRHRLHQYPELSGCEQNTSKEIVTLLKQLHPTQIHQNIGGTGILAIFDSEKPGPTVVFRAELDALPVQETTSVSYASKSQGVGHLCGHDGHMVILLGLAHFISKHMQKMKGKAAVLFQPAEETAQGAKKIMDSSEFHSLQPTHIFALHNLPGFQLGQVIVKKDVFAWASIGVKLFFHGHSSHAGYPEEGLSPLPAMIECMRKLEILTQSGDPIQELVTIIHTQLGEEAFGTTPGEGIVMATLRACSDDRLDVLKSKIQPVLTDLEKTFAIKTDVEWVEYFPVVTNHASCVDIIRQSAVKNHLLLQEITTAFRWTEDFSFYTKQIPGCFCGLGSGIDQPPLHAPTYDFPDDLIDKGIALFSGVVEQLLYE
jgi:amidohydrolase